jgi:hypothetical protein
VLVTATPSAAATVQVVVVEQSGWTAYGPEGARGLLVPAAGPTTSREQALAALVRGRVRNSLLEGPPEGAPLIEVGERPGADVTISVSLPPPGVRPNDRRYGISIVGRGYAGTLESPSTRIPGLVSIADVAPTVVALERGEEPRLTATSGHVDLEELDTLIRDKNAARAPAMLLVAAAIALLAVWRPRAAVAAISAVLLANVALGIAGAGGTAVVLVVLAAAALAAVPWARTIELGAALAATVLVYLLALGLDNPDVALSPLGPTQNARFYGLSNVLATLLLAAAVAGAGIVGRRYGVAPFALVAGAAFAATAGSAFGADGGGAVVLAASFAVLTTMLYGRRAAVLLVAATVVAFALDLALGESHVTRALENGVWDDLTRRAELSWERATKTWYDALYLGALLVALAVMAGRTARRDAILAALAVGLGVSLAVNDSPNEVLVPGVACYFALSSWIVSRERLEA